MPDTIIVAVIGGVFAIVSAWLNQQHVSKINELSGRRNVAFTSALAVVLSITALVAAILPWFRSSPPSPPAMTQEQVEKWIDDRVTANNALTDAKVKAVADREADLRGFVRDLYTGLSKQWSAPQYDAHPKP